MSKKRNTETRTEYGHGILHTHFEPHGNVRKLNTLKYVYNGSFFQSIQAMNDCYTL